MSRMVNTASAGKERVLLEKGIVLAVRELARQPRMSETTRDLLAYIALSLQSIGDTIDQSVVAWEKRGYWIKADRYRMEWAWAGRFGEEMKEAILTENWLEMARITALVTEKLSTVKLAQRNRLGSPWVGAYKKLISPGQSH